MSKYTGDPVEINRPTSEVYSKLVNVPEYEKLLEKVPEETRAQLNGLEIDGGKIVIDAPGVGKIELDLDEQVPDKRVTFKVMNAPVELALCFDLEAEADNKTRLHPSIEAEIPAMLKPFLNTKLQQASSMLGKAFSQMFG